MYYTELFLREINCFQRQPLVQARRFTLTATTEKRGVKIGFGTSPFITRTAAKITLSEMKALGDNCSI